MGLGVHGTRRAGAWSQICSEEHVHGGECDRKYHQLRPPLDQATLGSPQLRQLFAIRDEVRRSLGATTVVIRQPRALQAQQALPIPILPPPHVPPVAFFDLNFPIHFVAWSTDTELPAEFTFYPSNARSDEFALYFNDYHETLKGAGFDEIELYLPLYGMWIHFPWTCPLTVSNPDQVFLIRDKGVTSHRNWRAMLARLD
ncbi:hypothetical protein C8J57DRAFT_1378239 [Mycena rebaudengoi]|nr:hypothetical protein C8J57DRAFT_1378239 [Mycena rebaudengoi]